MPQGDKSSYADEQKRQAAQIEDGYWKKGMSVKSAGAQCYIRRLIHIIRSSLSQVDAFKRLCSR
jgi:hypothetical protein